MEYFNQLYFDNKTSKLNEFCKIHGIVINPTKIYEIFENLFQLPEGDQLNYLKELKELITKNGNNSIQLMQHSGPPLKMKQNLNLMDYLIKTVVQHEESHQSIISSQILEILAQVLYFNSANRNNLVTLQEELSEDFFNNHIDYRKLKISLQILHEIFKNEQPQINDISTFFYFNKATDGMVLQTNPVWPFSNGLVVALWVYIEDTKAVGQETFSRLYKFHSNKKEGGGFECYLIQNDLYYRSLTSNYSLPNQSAPGVNLCKLRTSCWNFFAVEHQKGGTFSKATLNFYLNNEQMKQFSYEFPKVAADSELSSVSFGDNFCGKISSIVVFNGTVGSKLIQFSQIINKHFQILFTLQLRNNKQ